MRFEILANIEFLVKLKQKASGIIDVLVHVYGFDAQKNKNVAVNEQIKLFKEGRKLIEDDPREGLSSTSITVENVAAVRDLLLVEENRRLTIPIIAKTESLDFSAGSV